MRMPLSKISKIVHQTVLTPRFYKLQKTTWMWMYIWTFFHHQSSVWSFEIDLVRCIVSHGGQRAPTPTSLPNELLQNSWISIVTHPHALMCHMQSNDALAESHVDMKSVRIPWKLFLQPHFNLKKASISSNPLCPSFLSAQKKTNGKKMERLEMADRISWVFYHVWNISLFFCQHNALGNS